MRCTRLAGLHDFVDKLEGVWIGFCGLEQVQKLLRASVTQAAVQLFDFTPVEAEVSLEFRQVVAVCQRRRRNGLRQRWI